MSNRKQPFRLLPRPCWHWLKWGGTFHSATDGTFQTDTDGTNHSDIPGTFESDMGGTFNPLLSNKYKYTYGRKVTEAKYLAEEIKLPIKNGEPDWEFMTMYMCNLPYGDRVFC